MKTIKPFETCLRWARERKSIVKVQSSEEYLDLSTKEKMLIDNLLYQAMPVSNAHVLLDEPKENDIVVEVSFE